MYYHTDMRLVLPICIALLLLAPASAQQNPQLVLRGIATRGIALPTKADWRSPRFFGGIGWDLGTASREESDVMTGGYTVIQDETAGSVTLQNCYVLAAFDLLPDKHLLVCVRDPELYWESYDLGQEVADPIDLVWYDADWEELYYTTLDYSSTERPDEFVLSPQGKALVAINKPVDPDSVTQPGHLLNIIYLRDGLIGDLWLPGYDGYGNPPTAWIPVRMAFEDDGGLQVQAGGELRVYELEWR